jgi:hypothetical protein
MIFLSLHDVEREDIMAEGRWGEEYKITKYEILNHEDGHGFTLWKEACAITLLSSLVYSPLLTQCCKNW